MKKLVSILVTATMTVGIAANAFAVSDDIFSSDTETITAALTSMTDSDREAYIDENLDISLQDMSVLVTLTANQEYGDIDEAVAKALEDGLSAVEIKEAIYQSAPYCGYTRAINAMDAADEALTARGEALPTESRITSTEEDRYNDGLAVQRHIFGPQIGTITEDMPSSQRLQTLYLSGICFGDFYNRAGLSLNTREFLTFCTIVANGSCTSQVSSHTTGNLNVGHSKDMLIAALLLNEQYNGMEKTVTALAAVNAVEGEPVKGVTEPAEATVIDTDYTTDSAELEGIISHYETDDDEDYIDTNIDDEAQRLIVDAVNAYIDGSNPAEAEDDAVQALIDLALLGAEGGREADIPAAVQENLSVGNTADTMLAMSLLCTPYNGFPRTLNLMSAVNAALAETSVETESEIVISMQIGEPNMMVNGETQEIDPGMGTVPLIMNDRTLIPIRAVVEAFGGEVSWNGDTRTAMLSYGENTIELTIDSTTAYLNGEAQTLDTTPVIINDRTMLPIRFISEGFGFDVEWEQSTQTVTISGSTAGATQTEPTVAPAVSTTAEPSSTESVQMGEQEENKMLVVYFSATGNTESLAQTIAEVTGADIYEIVPEDQYTSEDLNYSDDSCRANQEMNDPDARPAIVGEIENIDEYDTILLGYPIWWGTMPRIINTFLDTYDLSGKTIMPFCTSGSSGITASVSSIRSICKDSDVTDGMRGTSSTSEAQVEEWLSENGVEME